MELLFRSRIIIAQPSHSKNLTLKSVFEDFFRDSPSLEHSHKIDLNFTNFRLLLITIFHNWKVFREESLSINAWMGEIFSENWKKGRKCVSKEVIKTSTFQWRVGCAIASGKSTKLFDVMECKQSVQNYLLMGCVNFHELSKAFAKLATLASVFYFFSLEGITWTAFEVRN